MSDEIAYLFKAPLPTGSSRTPLPPANDAFGYTAGRAMEFWPTINGNNATWFEDDIRPLYEQGASADLTFKGKLVNLNHKIGPNSSNLIIGSIFDEAYIPGVGVDTINRLDKRLLTNYQINPDEFASRGEYANQSVEIACDRSKSRFIVMKNPGSKRIEDQQVYSADEAASLGIRRTHVGDPLGAYFHEDKYEVVEACIPQVVRGIAMLPNPADKNALIYDVAAGQDDLFGDMSGYDNVDPMGMSDEGQSDLPDDAFAVVDAKTEMAGQEPKPYGDVHYADPKNGKYPVNTPEHARAAWDYINHPKYAAEYEPGELALVKAHIRAACKHFGIKIGDEDAAMSGPTRQYPLYETPAKHAAQQPHKRLVKAAMDALSNPKHEYPKSVQAVAVQRIKKAHNELQKTGDTMTPEEKAALTDPLTTEIAGLQAKITAHATEKAALEDNIALKEQAHATALASKDDEIANLKKQIEDIRATEVASQRLAELKALTGYEVKADEEAGLVEALKSENDDQFKLRKLTAENDLLRKGVKQTDENAGKTEDEIAGLRNLTNGGSGDKPKNPLAALFA